MDPANTATGQESGHAARAAPDAELSSPALRFFARQGKWSNRTYETVRAHAMEVRNLRHSLAGPHRIVRTSGRRSTPNQKLLELAHIGGLRHTGPVDGPSHVRQSYASQNGAAIRLGGVCYLPGFSSGCRCE